MSETDPKIPLSLKGNWGRNYATDSLPFKSQLSEELTARWSISTPALLLSRLTVNHFVSSYYLSFSSNANRYSLSHGTFIPSSFSMRELCRSVSHLLLGHILPSPPSNAFFQVEWPCDASGTRERQWLPEGRSHVGEAGGKFSIPLEEAGAFGNWRGRRITWYSGVTAANMKQLSKEGRAGSSRQHLSSKLGPSWEWDRAEQKLTQMVKDAGATDLDHQGYVVTLCPSTSLSTAGLRPCSGLN